MKKLLTFLTTLFVLTSCTGGAESATGGAALLDYLPSALMLGGAVLAGFGGYKKVKTNVSGTTEIAWGVILLVSGIIFYFIN